MIKNKFIFPLIISLLLLSQPLWAQSAPQKVLDIKTWTLANGVRGYYVNAPDLPMVDVLVAFDAGSARDRKHLGAAVLTSNILSQGADNLDADEIATSFDNVGAQFSADAGRDQAVFSLRTLSDKKYLEPAVNTFSKIISAPSFPEDAFARSIQQAIAQVKQQQQSPQQLAGVEFYQSLYGDTPYAHAPIGTEESLKEMELSDLEKFYKKYYVGSNAIVVIVGAVSFEQAKELSQTLAGQLPKGEIPQPITTPKPLNNAITQHINFPSSQTYIRLGQLGITYQDPDYFPLSVGNYILGGSGLVSELFKQVREQRGLSYGVSSSFIPSSAQGPFVIQLQTENSQAQQAIDVVQQTLQHFLKEGPSEEQLTAAKQNLVGGFALKLSSNAMIATNVLNIAFYHLPLDYLDTYRDKVNSVTLPQIMNAFNKAITPNKMVLITVGNNQQIHKQAA